MTYLTDVLLMEEVSEAVEGMARDIFEQCGAVDDYCVQNIGTNIVFGGVNRLILTHKGWSIDRGYCTEQFIKRFYARSN